MEIGDRLEFELVDVEESCSCQGCFFKGMYNCPKHFCYNGIFKLLPKQNRITFENVSSNILCGGNGERKLLDLTLPITPGNEVQCNTAYCKSGKLRVIVEWE